jgi:ABC-type nickel/cobalt efflux system permease component RcnA
MRRFLKFGISILIITAFIVILINKSLLFSQLAVVIRNLSSSINEVLREIKAGANLSAVFFFLGISFLYGIIHSIGPGHGKALILAYFLKNKHRLWKSVTLAGITSLTHTFGAILLAFLFNTILSEVKGMFRIQIQGYFVLANGILILSIGLFYFIIKIRKSKKQASEVAEADTKNFLIIGISAGMVPCPASLLIMLYSISNDVVGFGLLSVLAISLGMFMLLVLVGAAGIASRAKILSFFNKLGKHAERLPDIFEYLSIFLIIGIGLMMIVLFI